MPLENYRKFAAVLIGLAVLSGSVSVQAGAAFEGTKKFLEKTKRAIMGSEAHEVSLFSTIQNYQLKNRYTMRSVLITLKVSSDDALAYYCRNEAWFREAVLRAVTAYHRRARGGKKMRAAEVSRRAQARFGRQMKKGWLMKVDARFIKSISEGRSKVMKTKKKCKAALS